VTGSDSLPAPTAPRTGIWARPLAAAKANLFPGLVLQAFALAFIVAYYRHPPAREALDRVTDFKARTGFLYSFFATAFFGGLIPFLYFRIHPATRPHTPASHGMFLLLFWGFRGVEVDCFYRFQSWLWGDAVDVKTVAVKVVVDLFIYCPLWATWSTLLLFQWKESGFDPGAMRRLEKTAFLRENLPAALAATWIVWLPAVAMIYSLPPALQVPLFNIVLCFFSLLYVTLTRRAGT
jgi:hypothetical protein